MNAKLLDIQVLRFLAAFLVVLSHVIKELHEGVYQTENGLSFLLIGQFGVDLFFVISGFIMVYVSRNNLGGFQQSKEFLLRRICRIVPLYWLFTFVTIAATIALPEAKNNNDINLLYTIKSLFFIPHERLDGNITPVLGLGWTLNYEMFFYLIFSLSFMVTSKSRSLAFLTALSSLVAIGFFVEPNSTEIKYWTGTILFEFAFGYVLAILYIKGLRVGRFIGGGLVVSGISLLLLSTQIDNLPTEPELRGFIWGVPALLIFGGVVFSKESFFHFLPKKIHALFVRLGDGSFSLYLGHMFVVRACSIILPLIIPYSIYNYAYSILVIILCCIMSDFMYRYFEVPTNRFFLKLAKLK